MKRAQYIAAFVAVLVGFAVLVGRACFWAYVALCIKEGW